MLSKDTKELDAKPYNYGFIHLLKEKLGVEDIIPESMKAAIEKLKNYANTNFSVGEHEVTIEKYIERFRSYDTNHLNNCYQSKRLGMQEGDIQFIDENNKKQPLSNDLFVTKMEEYFFKNVDQYIARKEWALRSTAIDETQTIDSHQTINIVLCSEIVLEIFSVISSVADKTVPFNGPDNNEIEIKCDANVCRGSFINNFQGLGVDREAGAAFDAMTQLKKTLGKKTLEIKDLEVTCEDAFWAFINCLKNAIYSFLFRGEVELSTRELKNNVNSFVQKIENKAKSNEFISLPTK